MNRAFLTILTLGLVAAAAPLALADETKADCEPGQQWAGYASTDAQRELIQGFTGDAVAPCEGEHWDGQDSVQPAQNPGTDADCGKGQTNANPSADDLFVGWCMAPNPNTGGADPLAGNNQPLTFRASSKGTSASREAYAGFDIALVGRAVVYAGECQGGGAGLEGASACQGGGQQRAGVYLRDNTPGNVLAQAVSAPGITKGYVSEADCDQATYADGANHNDRTKCGRDNTAVTVQTLLP